MNTIVLIDNYIFGFLCKSWAYFNLFEIVSAEELYGIVLLEYLVLLSYIF